MDTLKTKNALKIRDELQDGFISHYEALTRLAKILGYATAYQRHVVRQRVAFWMRG